MVNYYEFINRKTIKPAPRPLRIDGEDIITTDETIYNENGYYRLVRENMPSSTQVAAPGEEPAKKDVYLPYYEREGNIIYQRWEKAETEGE